MYVYIYIYVCIYIYIYTYIPLRVEEDGEAALLKLQFQQAREVAGRL